MEEWLEFWSVDLRFGLRIGHSQIQRVVYFCQAVQDKETGGILAGYYTHNLDCAIITGISGPPSDSFATHNRFFRGIISLQGWLDRLWKKERQYYLGEWHFHPGDEPSPSLNDINQMVKFAGTPGLHCPEPVLLIVGYNPGIMMPSECFKAFVFNDRQCTQLYCSISS